MFEAWGRTTQPRRWIVLLGAGVWRGVWLIVAG